MLRGCWDGRGHRRQGHILWPVAGDNEGPGCSHGGLALAGPGHHLLPKPLGPGLQLIDLLGQCSSSSMRSLSSSRARSASSCILCCSSLSCSSLSCSSLSRSIFSISSLRFCSRSCLSCSRRKAWRDFSWMLIASCIGPPRL